MAQITVDLTTETDELSAEIAPDGPGDEYTIDLGSLQLTVNYAQLEAIYNQVRGWFEE